MEPQLPEPIRAAEEAVTELVAACRKKGPLYNQHPRAVAQLSRTGKWLLNAISALRRQLEESATP